MDHYQRSLHNLFTASPLDRASDRRRDEQWLAAQQNAPTTRFVLIWRLLHLVAREPQLRPVFLSPQELHERVDDMGMPMFLGVGENRSYFAANLPASIAAVPDSLTELGQFRELRQVAALLDAPDAALLAHARAMAYWHQRHRFCGDCGSPTESREGGYLRVCSNAQCAQHHFPRSDPAIIVLVESENRCLLGRKPSWPEGMYSTIAGFVEPGECIETAVIREVREETGVQVGEMFYQSSQPWPFPSSLMLGFRARAADSTIRVEDQDELQDVQWFMREQIRSGLMEKSLQLPPNISVSHRLIEGWFDEGQLGSLKEIIPD
ncbi:MAG: NAD(+) diphosphatase [Anaerolineae bacterium]|nr:NAD(+) diphosphatase [Anaerolineae bacterium]